MRYIVTGAAGFIGSNIIQALNQRGITDIIAVDAFKKSIKYKNLIDLKITDYFDKAEFLEIFKKGYLGKIMCLFHEGACSNTTEDNAQYMMSNNYRYSINLLDICTEQKIPYLYASSASVYGDLDVFQENLICEKPLNIYAYSKFLLDQVVRFRILQKKNTSQIIGLRYFNVYGPRETHKEHMASVIFHRYHQFMESGVIKLFAEYDGYAAGEQCRDFVNIQDVVKVNLFFLDHPEKNGIFNLGTGQAQSFNTVISLIINTIRQINGKNMLSLSELVDERIIEYTPIPTMLIGKYQSFTKANLVNLRKAGYTNDFLSIQDGVSSYVHWLKNNQVFAH